MLTVLWLVLILGIVLAIWDFYRYMNAGSTEPAMGVIGICLCTMMTPAIIMAYAKNDAKSCSDVLHIECMDKKIYANKGNYTVLLYSNGKIISCPGDNTEF